jgi:hypothetical protein
MERNPSLRSTLLLFIKLNIGTPVQILSFLKENDKSIILRKIQING